MKKTTAVLLIVGIAVSLFVLRNKILSHGAAGGNGALVKLALLLGADPNGGDADVPPLVAAARNGDAANVERLLDAKANVDAKEKESGRTALMFAAEAGNGDIVDALLRAKPKLEILDKSDKSAYSYAFANNHFDVAHRVRPERPPVMVDMPEPDTGSPQTVGGVPGYKPPTTGAAADMWKGVTPPTPPVKH